MWTEYFASASELFGDYISLLLEAGRYEAAFEVAERAKARAFLDLLRQSRGEVREGVDPILHAEEHRLLQQISAVRELVIAERSRPHREEATDSEADRRLRRSARAGKDLPSWRISSH